MRADAEMQRHLENNGFGHLQLQTATLPTGNTVRNPTIRLDPCSSICKSRRSPNWWEGVMTTGLHSRWMSKSNRAAPDGHERELERL